MKIAQDAYVRFSFRFFNEAGDLIHESDAESIPWYIHGHELILPAMEKGLESHAAGDVVEMTITPEEGFGHPSPSMVNEIPKESWPDDFSPDVGQMIYLNDAFGHSIPAKIVEVKPEGMVVDANHPLAGLTLTCQMTVHEVREATAEEMEVVTEYHDDCGSEGCSSCGGGCGPNGCG